MHLICITDLLIYPLTIPQEAPKNSLFEKLSAKGATEPLKRFFSTFLLQPRNNSGEQ